MVSPPFGKCGQPPAVVVQRLAAEAALPVYHDSTGFARGCLLSAGWDLTVAAGADIIKIEKGAATSGWLFSRIRNQAKARNRHLAEWRFLRFLMMIVTVKLPMCIVIRMVSPPLGKCGQPPAVVVQRLAAEAALPVYHDSTGFARVALILIYKKKRPEPKFGSLFGAEDGTFPGALLFTHHISQAIESVAATDSVFVFMGVTERLRQLLVLPMKR